MHTYPHNYKSSSSSTMDSLLKTSVPGLNEIDVTKPVEFDGPKGHWSPEALFSASISSCFILTFKNYSRFKKLNWSSINVEVEAFLDKTTDGLKFNLVKIYPTLEVCCAADADQYIKALFAAKEQCLITKSINCEIELFPKVKVKAH
jgi:organic hydroperoxide reductase OsmC/OhrA